MKVCLNIEIKVPSENTIWKTKMYLLSSIHFFISSTIFFNVYQIPDTVLGLEFLTVGKQNKIKPWGPFPHDEITIRKISKIYSVLVIKGKKKRQEGKESACVQGRVSGVDGDANRV